MRVFLSGPDFHDYNKFVSNAFETLGHEVIVSDWPELWGSLPTRARLYAARHLLSEYRFQEYVLDEIDDVISAYNERILRQVEETDPDLFLVLNGKVILPETVERLNEHTRTAIWCYDKATAFPAVVESVPHYDQFYVFESSDVDALSDRRPDVTFLPMGYDPGAYYPSEEAAEDIDVVFVGSLDNRRKRLLGRITDELPEVNLQVWGNNWSWYNPFAQLEYRVRRPALGRVVNNYNLSAAEVNEVYNRARICLNIHGPHSKRATNPRTFEICGAGGFQLVDHKPRLPEQLTVGNEVVTYTDGEELVEQIRYYLDNPDERQAVAAAGHERVENDHTYADRIDRIVTDYQTAQATRL